MLTFRLFFITIVIVRLAVVSAKIFIASVTAAYISAKSAVASARINGGGAIIAVVSVKPTAQFNMRKTAFRDSLFVFEQVSKFIRDAFLKSRMERL